MNKIIYFSVILCSFIRSSYEFDCNSKDTSDESRIKRKILCGDYDNSVRPVKDHKTTTTVNIKMIVKSYDFDEHSSTLTLNTWMANRWVDEFLVWEPLAYNNLKSVDIDSELIWRPDFALYNADISYGTGSCHKTGCLVEHTGNITCIEPCSYVGHCKTNFALWPYDRQNCSMSFGPWMNSEDEVDYISSSTEQTLMAWDEHTQWKLVSAFVARREYSIISKDKKFITKFPNLIYFFVIERHSSLITKVILGASFILMSINVFALFIGSELNERLSLLAVNILLHFQIVHQVSWMLPYGDTIPKTMIYLRNSMIITSLLLLESLLIKTFSLSERTPPALIQSVVSFIKQKHLGFIFLETIEDEETSDGSILIQSKQTSQSSNNKIWRNLSSFIDKALLFIIVAMYVIQGITLIPFGYAINRYPINTNG